MLMVVDEVEGLIVQEEEGEGEGDEVWGGR